MHICAEESENERGIQQKHISELFREASLSLNYDREVSWEVVKVAHSRSFSSHFLQHGTAAFERRAFWRILRFSPLAPILSMIQFTLHGRGPVYKYMALV